MYLGYARTHSDELAVLKPKKKGPVSGAGSCELGKRAAGQPGSWAGATHGLPFYVWVCSFGRIRRGSIWAQSSVRYGMVQFSILYSIVRTWYPLAAIHPSIRICESISIVMGATCQQFVPFALRLYCLSPSSSDPCRLSAVACRLPLH